MTRETREAAALFGVDSIYLPNEDEINTGVMGVSLLEEYCVLTFLSEVGQGMVGIELSSRFNSSYVVKMPGVRIEAVSGLIASYRPACSGKGELDMDPMGITTTPV